MNFTETDLGFTQEKDGYLIFFGKNSATLDQIKQAYPELTFRTVHQKHTDVCVPSSPDSGEVIADAHFTDEARVALVVKTADCIPLLVYSKKQNLILAIHAGWRGVENQITAKSFVLAKMQEAEVFVGPHILQQSFEVDLDVKEQLEKVYLQHTEKSEAQVFISRDSNVFIARDNKFYVDLKTILEKQIQSTAIPFHLHELTIDTVSDTRLHSYRRDKQTSGRNLSFITRLKS
ncbi:MAG: polyphenol oxidase family protein [Pseudobdellovibrio sp.]|nr:polyphenol oxidase family protein [Pseudobdellovibrio sp.]